LQWLLDFVQRPGLASLKDQALEDAIAEVAFFSAGLTHTLGQRPALTSPDLEYFAIFVRTGLITLLERHQPWEMHMQPGASIVHFVVRTTGGESRTSYYSQDLQLAARLNAQELIGQKLAAISRCPRSKCGRFFLASVGRQKFCSHMCSQIERTARWRKKNRKKFNEQRRARYSQAKAREQGRETQLKIQRTEIKIQKRSAR
jgi:hypothetical protein